MIYRTPVRYCIHIVTMCNNKTIVFTFASVVGNFACNYHRHTWTVLSNDMCAHISHWQILIACNMWWPTMGVRLGRPHLRREIEYIVWCCPATPTTVTFMTIPASDLSTACVCDAFDANCKSHDGVWQSISWFRKSHSRLRLSSHQMLPADTSFFCVCTIIDILYCISMQCCPVVVSLDDRRRHQHQVISHLCRHHPHCRYHVQKLLKKKTNALALEPGEDVMQPQH